MKHDLLTLVTMKILWPRGPGPKEHKTELHLNHAIEKELDALDRVHADIDRPSNSRDCLECGLPPGDACHGVLTSFGRDAHAYHPPKQTPVVREAEKSTFSFKAWCPVCGPQVNVDEDECCLMCGCTAMGEGATNALVLLSDAIECACTQGIVSQKDPTECARCGKRLRPNPKP